ncbi:MAG TPA: permease, partial [bacterium]|nr:permease [bacterium]
MKLPENRTSLKTIFKAFLFLLTTNILLLKMENIANWITVSIFKLDTTTKLGSAIEFFIFEAPKVLLLLAIIVFIIGIIRTFFTPEKTRKILAGKRAFTGNILASLLGVTTPFCTCSAIPLFIGFITSGVPLGVTFSFLISAPMINEVALILLLGMFGWKVALLYLTTGLFIAIVSGWVIGKLKLERYVEEWVYNNTDTATNNTINITSWQKRIEIGFNNVKEIVGKVWSYLLIGIAIGSFFHGYIPENYLAGIMGKNAFWSVPLAVLIGVPL